MYPQRSNLFNFDFNFFSNHSELITPFCTLSFFLAAYSFVHKVTFKGSNEKGEHVSSTLFYLMMIMLVEIQGVGYF